MSEPQDQLGVMFRSSKKSDVPKSDSRLPGSLPVNPDIMAMERVNKGKNVPNEGYKPGLEVDETTDLLPPKSR